MAVKCCEHCSTYIFDWIFFILSCNKDSHEDRMSSKFGKIRPWTAELAALERLKKSPLTYNGKDIVNAPAPSFRMRSGNKDSHKISDEFEIQGVSTMDC